MKKFICSLLIFVFTFSNFTVSFAEFKPNYSTDFTRFSGDAIVSEKYYDTGFDSNLGYFTSNSYVDLFGNIYKTEETETSNIDSVSGNCDLLWLKPRNTAITKREVLCALYVFALIDYGTSYYPYGDITKFADIDQYSDCKRVIEVFSGYDEKGNTILNGTERDGKLYLDLDKPITKAELAKLITNFNAMYLWFSDKSQEVNLCDVNTHWAKIYIDKLHTLGWYTSSNGDYFYPDSYCSIEEFVKLLFDIDKAEFIIDIDSYLIYIINSTEFVKLTNWHVDFEIR